MHYYDDEVTGFWNWFILMVWEYQKVKTSTVRFLGRSSAANISYVTSISCTNNIVNHFKQILSNSPCTSSITPLEERRASYYGGYLVWRVLITIGTNLSEEEVY